MAGQWSSWLSKVARKHPLATQTLVYIVPASAFFYLYYRLMMRMFPGDDDKKALEMSKKVESRLNIVIDDKYEKLVAGDVIDPADIQVTFDSIGGVDHVKRELKELVILPLLRPDIFSQGSLLKPPKGILLLGPPGCGKTMLAKAIAKETKAVFIDVKLSSLMSKWFGESNKLVNALFSLAHRLSPTILFIDEIDGFLSVRNGNEHEVSNQLKTQFLTLWDGLTTSSSNNVIVMGATNRPWDIDHAIRRRLPRTFAIGLPDEAQRQKIFQLTLASETLSQDFDYSTLAENTAGYSGSDIQELCKAAAAIPVREFLQDEETHGNAMNGDDVKLRCLQESDFVSTIKTFEPTGVAGFKHMLTECHRRGLKYDWK
eukprot:GFYU01005494.1.p1 GENE.GFYU01005494.1~~GFYU01005494.1.p1  ORF type:complete len:372 (+),score=73.69 GFYU01005494.1:56-1171(+)